MQTKKTLTCALQVASRCLGFILYGMGAIPDDQSNSYRPGMVAVAPHDGDNTR